MKQKHFARKLVAVTGAFALGLGISAAALAQQFTMKLSSPTANDLQIEWMNTFKKGVKVESHELK